MPAVEDAKNTNLSELFGRVKRRMPVESLTTQDVDDATRLIFDHIGDTLARGDRVELRGFGSFDLRIREPRTARNPKTGAPVLVGLRRIAHFKPGAILRDRLLRKRRP